MPDPSNEAPFHIAAQTSDTLVLVSDTQDTDSSPHPPEMVAAVNEVGDCAPTETLPARATAPLVIIEQEQALPSIPISVHNKRKKRLLDEVTPESLTVFFEHIQKTAQINMAAHAAGICISTINRLRRTDSEFDAMVKEHIWLFCDKMEGRAYELAFYGWDEDVFTKSGEKCGVKWQHDSRLAELLLKRHVREFNPNVQVDVAVSGGVLIAPVMTASVEEWQRLHGKVEGDVVEGTATTVKVLSRGNGAVMDIAAKSA
jgi:hypothetical protein